MCIRFVGISLILLFVVLQLVKKTEVTGLFSSIREDEYASPYIYMIDREDKEVVYSKNATTKAFPASLTKVMTTIVALEHIHDLSTTAPIDTTTYQELVAQNASMAGFYGREAVTYRDLLYGTILSSGGEAANTLAIQTAGSVQKFVELMNVKAKELGMQKTNFTNPEGLHHENQYTTAYDMATLLDYALDNNHFKTIFTKETFQTTSTIDHPNGITLKSTVLSTLTEDAKATAGIIGGKSGTTYEAGQCWATLGSIAGSEYITIVMGAPLDDIRQPDRAQVDDSLQLYATVRNAQN